MTNAETNADATLCKRRQGNMRQTLPAWRRSRELHRSPRGQAKTIGDPNWSCQVASNIRNDRSSVNSRVQTMVLVSTAKFPKPCRSRHSSTFVSNTTPRALLEEPLTSTSISSNTDNIHQRPSFTTGTTLASASTAVMAMWKMESTNSSYINHWQGVSNKQNVVSRPLLTTHHRSLHKRIERRQGNVRQVRRCKHRAFAWAFHENFLNRCNASMGHQRTLWRSARPYLYQSSHESLAKNWEESWEDEKEDSKWTANINNVYQPEARRKLRKITMNCKEAHYKMMANLSPI